ncbi:potassium channel subfamily K member 5 isoform X2 [Exaiptasia diaphana]|uniref:Potassium channel domain-containing protein n=1 Tax=Exaiptasia diaphana TaxID=2652724 RepID=A0A913XAU0_EXADI|nr:potassium channel subfamily K member 5 isoform X2 [Exaiptasia diaphana]XP_020901705.1 potassium channel subfamily K member 5 isoform X2 [Exaiptasia diaphana]XP_020901706.1 potassium channel subfamily K member 5 isoform X2 [Exaiptasia diaphana]XP_020901707.1 potassium channel subfamily K member 5 isoform X2 [Exaiptasia diaphana]XP_028515222.1 potassium channel subfamily K member 5 isoform X2 [Exaiptasia diaphana]
MFLGAPKATRTPYEGRDRAYTIEQMISTTFEPKPTDSRQRNKTSPTNSSHGKTRFIKIKERTKTLLFRLFLLGIYITSGAAIFHVIESRNKKEQHCHEYGDSKLEIEMAEKLNASREVIREFVDKLCEQFEDSHRCKYSHNDWSYYQSLYFVGSVTTTIGYGHLAPKTQAGRLFLIFYAFFGIPINLLALQSVGEHINVGFHKLITFVEKKLYKTSTVRHEHIKTFVLSVILMVLMLPIGGLMYYYSEKDKGWTYLDSVYYSFVAMSTIGFGDLVPNEGKEPETNYERVMWFIRLLFLGLGLSLVSSVFTSVSGATKQIKTAYMSKKGLYQVNRKRKHQQEDQQEERRSFKQAACIHVKGLLCNGNVDRTSRNTTSSLPSDVYSRFEDSLSTTSLSNNQSQHDDFVHEQTRGCRSVSTSQSTILDHNTNTSHGRSPNIEESTLELAIFPSNDVSTNTNNYVTSLDGNSNIDEVTSSPYEPRDGIQNTASVSHDANITSSNVEYMTSSQYVPNEGISNTNDKCNDINMTSSKSNNEDTTSSQYVQDKGTKNVTTELYDVSVTSTSDDTDRVTSPNDPIREGTNITDDSRRNTSCALLKNNCRDDVIPNGHVINEITAT